MSKLFLKYYLKSELRSKYLWGWSIAFMVFWLILGVAAISQKAAFFSTLEAKLSYAASWYSTVVIVGLGSAAVGLSYEFVYSSIAARYLTKYSRLTSSKLYAGLLVGFIIVCIIVAAILFTITYLLYSWRLGANLLPANPPGLIAATIATGIMLYTFAATIMYAMIALRKTGMMYFAAYLPMILALGLGITQVYVNLGWVIVASPFNAAETLLYCYYSGVEPRLASFIHYESGQVISPILLWCSLLAWTAGLSLLAILFLRLQKGVGVEELRLF